MINYWVAVSDSIDAEIMKYLNDREAYDEMATGALPKEHLKKFFGGIYDLAFVRSMFKPYNGRRLYSVYVKNIDTYNMLIATYSDTIELGGWDMAGNSVVSLSPEVDNYLYDTVNKQTNLLAGQSERVF